MARVSGARFGGAWVALAVAGAILSPACGGSAEIAATTVVGTTSTTAPTTTTMSEGSTSTLSPSTTAIAVSSTTSGTAPTTTTTTLPAWWRPVTTDDPLRVWVGGDSLAGPLGGALARRAAATGLISVIVDHQKGSGLVRDDVFDWPAFAADRLREVQPDAVVMLIGANDGQALRFPAGWLQFGTPEWDDEYAGRVGRFMALLAGGSTRIYWVGVPIMADAAYDGRVRHINALQQEQADACGQVVFVDAYSLFQDEAGQFSAELPDEQGNLVTVRLPDGIHLTAAGADRLARQVLSQVAGDWELAALLGE